jgi:hypothetical protein
MGKTYRKEKTFGPKKKKRLNNSRDLPDYQNDTNWDNTPFVTTDNDEEEEEYAKTIRIKERPDIDG